MSAVPAKVVVIGAAVSIGAAIAYKVWQSSKQFSFDVKGYGTPSWRGSSSVMIPLSVRFNNPAPASLPLDKVQAQFFLQRPDGWHQVGTLDQPLTLPPGSSDQLLTPVVDLSLLLGGSFTSILSNALMGGLNIRTDLTITAKGIQLPTRTYYKTLSL